MTVLAWRNPEVITESLRLDGSESQRFANLAGIPAPKCAGRSDVPFKIVRSERQTISY